MIGFAVSLLVLAVVHQAVAFTAWSSTRVASSALTMAGGRSQAEKLMTKKQLFKELRGKLNEAAQIPGFFEVGEGPAVRIEFLSLQYCNIAV